MTKTIQYSGTFTALLTPMRNGGVDHDSLRRMVDYQIEQGITGLVPVGTTGESPTLDMEEHIAVVRTVVEAVNGRVPVIAGTGANATSEALQLTKLAEDAGADGFLQVTPYYNKPTQEGLYQHFAKIAETTDKPIVLYSVPGRTGMEVGVETAHRLATAFPQICAIKEAGGNCDRVSQLLTDAPEGFTVLSGDDALTLPFMAVGARGVISVVSNILPHWTSRMVREALANDFVKARELHAKLFPLFRDSLAVASNPIPVKYAAARLGLIESDEMRLPLSPLDESGRAVIDRHLQDLQLL